MVWSDDGRAECDHCNRVYRGRLWSKADFKATGVIWCNKINGVNRCFCAFCLLTQDHECESLPRSLQRSLSCVFVSIIIPCVASIAGRWLWRSDNMPVSRMVNRSFLCPEGVQPDA